MATLSLSICSDAQPSVSKKTQFFPVMFFVTLKRSSSLLKHFSSYQLCCDILQNAFQFSKICIQLVINHIPFLVRREHEEPCL